MSIQFIIEDGTAKTDSTAYISTAELNQFYENNGHDWSVFSDDDEKQQYINRCTSYIDGNYEFSGYRKLSVQSLSWPRSGAIYTKDRYENSIADNVIPKEVKTAVAMLVYYTKAGYVSLDQYSSGSLVKRQLDRVEGAVTSETEYFGAGQALFSIVELDQVLKCVLSSYSKGNGVNSLIRGCE